MTGHRQRAQHRPGRRHWRFAGPGTAPLVWASAVICARKFDAASVTAPCGKLTRHVRRCILARVPALRLGSQGPEVALGRVSMPRPGTVTSAGYVLWTWRPPGRTNVH